MRKPIHSMASLLALLVLAGCGGSHHHSSSSDVTNIVLTTGEGYNGSSSNLTGTPMATGVNTGIDIELVDGSRVFDVTLPLSLVSAGSVITPGTSGVSFAYTETTAGTDGTLEKAWSATAGSVTITSIPNGKANATVSGLQFSPTTLAGNNAVGSFTANGKIVGIPVLAD